MCVCVCVCVCGGGSQMTSRFLSGPDIALAGNDVGAASRCMRP